MEGFDKMSIQQISKRDLLMIIEALEYTGSKTNIPEFINLRNNMVEELTRLTETTEEEFLAYLNKSI